MLPCIIMSDTQASTEIVKLPAGKQPAVRVMPMPSDANVHGDVFGGWIMSQVDIAGSIPAVVRANGRVATIAVNSFVFKQPVYAAHGHQRPPRHHQGHGSDPDLRGHGRDPQAARAARAVIRHRPMKNPA